MFSSIKQGSYRRVEPQKTYNMSLRGEWCGPLHLASALNLLNSSAIICFKYLDFKGYFVGYKRTFENFSDLASHNFVHQIMLTSRHD
jgi:hypothetical protein